jgi:3alpha(or 20beta)-hydroxysteroid dehydrogenase
MSGRLKGKVALISGAARGQGAAEARRFVAEGARVVISDVLDDEGEALARELGGEAEYQSLDVTDPEAWDRVVAATVARFGGLSILINNAGIGIVGLLDGLDVEDHRKIIDVNLNGVYLGMRASKSALGASGSGAIVNISSIDGLVGTLGMVSYSASKFAVTGMTRSAAIELGPLGIRVNSIHPGVIASPMVTEVSAKVQARLARLMAKQPIARMGEPEEVASLALFLASDEASYITGTQVVIDGGHLAGPYREPVEE